MEGIDVDEQTVETATRLFGGDGVHYQCHTAEQLPFEDHTFDVVCSFETIEHLDHPELFLQEIRRVLKPGGNIILSCPNDPYYYKQGTPGNRSTKDSIPILISSSWPKNISVSGCATIWRMP